MAISMTKSIELSRVRSVAGRKGGIARWVGVYREPTVKVRVFVSDLLRLKHCGKTIALAVRALLDDTRGAK